MPVEAKSFGVRKINTQIIDWSWHDTAPTVQQDKPDCWLDSGQNMESTGVLRVASFPYIFFYFL